MAPESWLKVVERACLVLGRKEGITIGAFIQHM